MSKAKKTAFLAAFTAAAVIFSYVEFLLPAPIIPIAGFKLGLSNVAVLSVMYLFRSRDALAVMILRTAISCLLFSGILPLAMSVCGGMLSFAVSALLKRTGKFSIIGVSVAGATFHNIGQCAAAALIVQSAGVAAYLPWLMVLSLVCGAGVGVAAGFIVKNLRRAL